MTTSHRFLRTVPLVLLWVGSLEAQSGVLQSAWTSPCTLDVVLVTFQDTTARHEGGRNARGDTIWAGAFNYHHHSRPHGYDRTRDGALVPGASSYRMEDFRRLFSGDYDYSVNGETARRPAPFVGDTVHVANRTQRLPEVFGSLRHYFHQVSGGDFELHVRILNQERYNAQQGGYYPVWIELPETKGYYAERFSANDEFWLDAEMAMRDSVRAWGLDPTTYNPPDASYLPARRLRHKVLYLHSGPEFHDERDGRRSRIHPRADGITWIDHSTGVVTPGFRYVAGERRGSGSNNHRADRFASIGIHAHEIGHLLGLNHTGGSWRGTNPYTNQTSDPRAPSSIPQLGTNAFGAARTVAWGIMHGAEGPPVEGSIVRQDSAWTYAHGSCPNPLSAPYRLQLGWIAPQHIPGTTFNQLIERGRFYSFASSVRDNATFILEFRSAQGFGQYTGWYRFTEAPGLLIWKAAGEQVLLIPADNRRIYNAKRRDPRRDVRPTPRAFSNTWAYPWIDRLSDPFGAPEPHDAGEAIGAMAYYAVDEHSAPEMPALMLPGLRTPVTAADDDSHFRRLNLTSSGAWPSRRAVRNIRVTRDPANPATGNALVDVYFDHWVGPITSESWSGTVYVGGDVTVRRTLTIEDNTMVHFLTPLGDDDSGRPDLIVSSGGTLTVGRGVTFGTADRDGARTSALGLRVETGGTATLNGVTLAEGLQHHWSGTVTVGGDLTVAASGDAKRSQARLQ